MWKFLIVIGFLGLHFELAWASPQICWDGTHVRSKEDCKTRPDPVEISAQGISTEGAVVFVYLEDSEIASFNFTVFGEMGKVDYWFYGKEFTEVYYQYNRPIYHEEFDFDASELEYLNLNYQYEDSGKFALIESNLNDRELESGRINECVINKIYEHMAIVDRSGEIYLQECYRR